MSVRLRYFAAAKAALGRGADTVEGVTDLGGLEAWLVASAPEAAGVLARCTYLIGGVSTTDRATPLTPDASVDVLPPFAGG
ncbi:MULTISPECIES: MoaD/ThiS family protein [unclassified Rathayibacter]|uniref:MoaD/ThiS family protein n=1 Tax=unclassified Rathayibacter TaxID=2609250 RepID=UPI00188B1875|nr:MULTISPECIES: MoaD/ThiS family protein [unclassified Rathayibacter]MBF4462145.1 MoaD/ThiS family protein [Rathayibacter sp. VKM Ac-2879]MBF4503812.1 MoaD/ThiS family protein [Rathayibacter sp. VKM Ac-2878]